MCRAERLQTDISQLHLFLSEFAAQLHHHLRLAVQTLRQSAQTQAGMKEFKDGESLQAAALGPFSELELHSVAAETHSVLE